MSDFDPFSEGLASVQDKTTAPAAPFDPFSEGVATDISPAQPPDRLSHMDAKNSLDVYDGVTPDQAAQVDQLSKEHGVPFNLALDNHKEFEKVSEANKIVASVNERDENGIPKFPNTADLLSDPIKFAKWRDQTDKLTAIESIIQKATPITKLERVKSIASDFARSFTTSATGLISGSMRMAAYLNPEGEKYRDLIREEMRKENPDLKPEELDQIVNQVSSVVSPTPESFKENPVFKGNKLVEEKANQYLQGDERLKGEFFSNTIPQGAGSMAFFMAGGLGSAALELPAIAFPLVGGALTQAQQAYDEAEAKGVDENTRMKAFFLNLPAGATEAIPLDRLFNKIEMIGGGAFKRKLFEAVKTGASESIQEMFQTTYGNAVAQKLYDSDRKLLDGTVESGKAGGLLGFLAHIIVPSAHHVHEAVGETTTAKEAAPLIPEVQSLTDSHIDSLKSQAVEITKLESQAKLLTDIKSQVGGETTGENVEGTNSLRDPEGLSDHINSTLEANGHPTEMEIDPEIVHNVLFQGAETPEAQAAAQKNLDIFAESVGVKPDDMARAIEQGHGIKINTGQFIGKYGTDPIFDAITKEMTDRAESMKQGVQETDKKFKEDVQKVQDQSAEPTQLTAIRENLMKSKEDGGAGLSAKEAQDQVAPLMNPIANFAKQQGISAQELFDRSNLSVEVGKDGRLFFKEKIAEMPEEQVRANLEQGIKDGNPVPKAAIDRLGIDIPDGYTDFGGFYAKFPEGYKATDEELLKAEKEADKYMQEMLGENMAGHVELLDAVMKMGGIPTPSNEKQASGLGGEVKALQEAAKKSPRYFRKKALSLDRLVEKLNAQGFDFATPTDLQEALYNRLNQGHKMYAGAPAGTLFQPEKLKTETPEFKNWFKESKVVDESGKPVVVYHGAKRVDRIGNQFRKSRATSGPMQYFTDDPELASSYSEGKEDTSLQHPDDYSGWFKFKGKGMRSPVDISRAWYHLSQEDRNKVLERIYTIGYKDHDAHEGPIVPDSGSIMSKDSIDYELRQSKGNGLKALVEIWLTSGSLFNDEETFMDVLKATGMDMSKVEFDSPWTKRSGVVPVYMSIQNPLDISSIPENVVKALERASKGKRAKTAAGGNSDAWDKNTISGKDWIEVLHNDLKNGDSHVWTRVPDWVTKTLSEMGYDGIKDIGGKHGGKKHGVWVPFEPTQIKSVNNRGTFDSKNPNILFSPEMSGAPYDPVIQSILDRAKVNGVTFKNAFGLDPKYLTNEQTTKLSEDSSWNDLKGLRKAIEGITQGESSGTLSNNAEGSAGGGADTGGGKTLLRRALDHKAAIKAEMAADYPKQIEWQNNKAKELGFSDYNDLLLNSKDEGLAKKLGAEYRDLNPWKVNGTEFNPVLFHNKRSPRGAFEVIGNKAIIHLFKSHDASTFLHEAHHFIVREFESLIHSGMADAQSLKDWQTLLNFVGSKDGKLTEDQQEKLADAGVTYFMEGRSPSPKLIDVFRRFKDRLLALYHSADALGVKMTDDIRSVFARWQASQSEIEQANQYYGLKGTIERLANTDLKAKQVESKMKDKSDANAQAKLAIQLKSVEQEIDAKPVYQILAKEKLNYDDLESEHGQEIAKELKARYPEMFDEEGRSPLDLAIEYGFNSPDDLIAELRNAVPREEAINQRKQELIKGKENEILGPKEEGLTKADEETHTQQTLELLIEDTNQMGEKQGPAASEAEKKARIDKMQAGAEQARLTAKAYRDAAVDALNQMAVGQAVDHETFARAEKRESTKVVTALSKGKKQAALNARQKQLFNHAMVLESIKLREEMQKIQKRYTKSKISGMLEKVENDFLPPIQTLMERFGFTDKPPAEPFDFNQMSTLDPYLAGKVPSVLTTPARGDVRKVLTPVQLRELDDFAQALIASGRNSLDSLKGSEYRQTQEFLNASQESMGKLKDSYAPQKGDALYKMIKVFSWLKADSSQVRFVSDTADYFSQRKMGKDGPMMQLFRGMLHADLAAQTMKKEVFDVLKEPMKVLEKAKARIEKEHGQYFDIEGLPLPPELKARGRNRWTFEALQSFLLNTGNEGNLKALQKGLGYGQEEINIASKFFTKEELKGIQGIWKAIDSIFPALDETHFAQYNRHLSKVDAMPIELTANDGSKVKLEGGYYPLKFDHEISLRAGEFYEEDLATQMKGVFRSAKPSDGFTKERQGGALPPKLSMDVLFKHINDTIHYTTHAAPIRDWTKITKNPDWAKTFQTKLGSDQYDAIRTWIQNQARATPQQSQNKFVRWMDEKLDKARMLSTYAMLGFKFKTGVSQRLGLINASRELGGWKWIIEGYKAMGFNSTTTLGLSNNDKWKALVQMSPVMAQREDNIDREYSDLKNSVMPNASKKIIGTPWTLQQVRDFGFEWMKMNDRAITSVTWHGAFQKHLQSLSDSSKPHDMQVKEAVNYADDAVLKSQPSSLKSDMSNIQNEKGWLRFLTSFMSWSYKFGNRLAFENRAMTEGQVSKKEYANHIIHEVMLEPWLRVALYGALAASAPKWWEFLSAPLEALTSWIPIVSNARRMLFPHGHFGFDVEGSMPVLEGAKRAVTTAKDMMKEEKDMGEIAWDLGRMTEFFTGVPALNIAQDIKTFHKNATKEEE